MPTRLWSHRHEAVAPKNGGGRPSAKPGNEAPSKIPSLIEQGNRQEPITTHGFRSAFRDWAGDRTAFARDVVEAALAHAIENKTEAAYRRSDALEKRRKLMTAWAAYCSSVAKEKSGKVTLLRRTAGS